MQFFCFRLGIAFLKKFGPRISNCQFNLKFGTLTKSNIQNSMVVFTLSLFDQKYCSNKSKFSFSADIGPSTDSNMHKSMVMFIFSVF